MKAVCRDINDDVLFPTCTGTTFLHIKKRVAFYGAASPYMVNHLLPAEVDSEKLQTRAEKKRQRSGADRRCNHTGQGAESVLALLRHVRFVQAGVLRRDVSPAPQYTPTSEASSVNRYHHHHHHHKAHN